MSQPRRMPFSKETPENQTRLLEYYAEAERIDKDPMVLAKHEKWLAERPWPSPVSPIVNAKLAAYSRICLDHTASNAYKDAILKQGKP